MSKAPWSQEAKDRVASKRAAGALGQKESAPDTAPKQRKSHDKKLRVTQDMAEALIQLVNLPLSMFMPAYALTGLESDALTVAITDLAAQNQMVANIIYNLVTVNKMAELPLVLGAIALNKLVVAGKAPVIAAIPAQGVLSSVATRKGKRSNADLDAGTARSANRTNGQREDHDSEGVTSLAGLRDAPDNETRSDSMAGEMGEGATGL